MQKVVETSGKLLVVSHSIEDKIKNFFSNFSSNKSKPSRYCRNDKENIFLFENYKTSF